MSSNKINNYQQYCEFFEDSLTEFFKKYPCNILPIVDAIKYGIQDGGKRVRPMLAYLAAEVFSKDIESVKNIALAVEMIHSYSLIHDDLPCMDNDVLRRGKSTTHVKFGEGMGVLAGDALLNLAFETLLSDCINANDIAAGLYISKQAGVSGMIGGQCIDIQNDKLHSLSEQQIVDLYEKKTACLLNCALVGSAIKCGATQDEIAALETYGKLIGTIFQIVDDILDITSSQEQLGKSIGKDALQDKKTFVALNGVENSKKHVHELEEKAVETLKIFGAKGSQLVDFCKYLTNRMS